MYSVLFTVRRRYYDQIAEGSKTMEVRRSTARWNSIARRIASEIRFGNKARAVFICGRLPKIERQITGCQTYATAEHALGRSPSDQGKIDIGEGEVIAFMLSDPVRLGWL